MRTKYTFPFAAILILLFSCNTREPIIRKWHLDHIDASGLIARMRAEIQDTLQLMIDQESRYQKGKLSFDFKEKGKVIIYSPDLQGNWETIAGTWILNEESKLLIIQMENKKDEYILHKVTEDELVIELIDKRSQRTVSGMVNERPKGTKVKSIFK